MFTEINNKSSEECSNLANSTKSVNSLVSNSSNDYSGNAQIVSSINSTSSNLAINGLDITSRLNSPNQLLDDLDNIQYLDNPNNNLDPIGFCTTYPDKYGSYQSYYGFRENHNEMTVELNLTDGTKLVDTFNRNRIYEIREKKNASGKKYTSFKYMSTVGVRDKKNDDLFEVDCSLIDLCYLLKIEYQSFSKTLLEHAVKDGK